MANVELRSGESQEQLLKRFRKEVTKSRVLSTARKKRWFTPPSEVRRIKKQKAVRKARQAQRKREQNGGLMPLSGKQNTLTLPYPFHSHVWKEVMANG